MNLFMLNLEVFCISALAKRQFVKNPKDLQGEVFNTRLLKGERGLGFTIIGGDNPDEEFLQIKNVVRNGPAFVDGKLQTGKLMKYFVSACSVKFFYLWSKGKSNMFSKAILSLLKSK